VTLGGFCWGFSGEESALVRRMRHPRPVIGPSALAFPQRLVLEPNPQSTNAGNSRHGQKIIAGDFRALMKKNDAWE